MDFRRLRTFVTIAEEGSVSKAASRLNLSQPALSRQLSELQQDFGLRLFDHVGRRLALTPEGEQFLGDCRELLKQTKWLDERARLLRRGDSGVLRIAASPVQIETIFAPFLHRYAERYPNVEVKLIEAVVRDVLALLERGEIHVGLLLQAVHADDQLFGRHVVPDVDLVSACHPTYDLARGDMIDIVELAAHPLLLLDTSFLMRRAFDAACRRAGVRPKVLFESRVPSNLLALAEAGHGVAVIQSVVATRRYHLRIASIGHKRRPLCEPLAVVWDKRRALPGYVQDGCRLLAEHMRDRARPRSPGRARQKI